MVTQGGHISTEPRINERIRVPEVRLVGPAGEQVGIVSINDALRLAQEADLDLVEVAPMARPPVCKLMDYGKFKYESALKARESRKNQAQTVIKEIKLRPKIDPHDYGTKKGHVERFLKQGDKVKVTIMFRGREQSRPELGFKLLQRLAGDIEEFGFVESSPKQDGRNMIMVIGPHRRKTEAMAAAKAERASRSSSRHGDSGRPEARSQPESGAEQPDEPADSGPAESAAQQSAAPESSAPESSAPESAAPESSTPESVAPESAAPESSTPESAASESAALQPEALQPEAQAAPPRPSASRPSAPRPSAARPSAARSSSAARPSAAQSSSAATPSGTSAAPRPAPPRATPATARPAAKPAPPRRAASNPVPGPRPLAGDRAQATSAADRGEAGS
jgi:translation initiation factor IF-3